ncbi:MAG: phosphate regulon sensor histidine kinase PhoR [Woeseiaceae bacterium]
MTRDHYQLVAEIVAIVLAGCGFGALLGFPLVGACVCLAGVVGYHLHELIQLDRALTAGAKIAETKSDGVWSSVFAGIRREQLKVNKHKGRHRELMKELRLSTNELPDGIVSLNNNNEIERYNTAARKLVGLRRRRDRGQRIDNLIRDPAFRTYLQNGDFSQNVVLPSRYIEDGWLSLTIVPYSRGNRLLIIRDITERTRLNRMRRDFVANASHELRTPLTVINGYLDAMSEDPELAGVWQKPLNEMTRQADRMRNMLDELLALSKLEMKRQASLENEVDVGAILREVAAPYDDESRSVIVRIESANAILGDHSDITSIATNLLTNALRYSPEGSEIVLRWCDGAEGEAHLVVIDQGEGIADEDIPRLTERFYRVNRGRERDTGGVGLGLAIVKHALARHDAELTIESEINVGSEFCCIFPKSRLIERKTAAIKAFRTA